MNEVYTDLEGGYTKDAQGFLYYNGRAVSIAPPKTTSELIIEECDRMRDLLLAKNAAYGNSVFNKGIAYDVQPLDAIKARINDKISRIHNLGDADLEDDAESDLIGYLILLKVGKKLFS